MQKLLNVLKLFSIFFYIQMNIFEPEDIDLIDTRLCKIKYLTHQNKWIANQYQNFNSLILKYKDLIELSSHQHAKDPNDQYKKLKDLNQTIKKFIKMCPNDAVTSHDIIHDDLQYNQIQLKKLVIGFQQKIQQIKALTVQSQQKLQKLEAQKGSSQINVQQYSQNAQRTNAIKSIESYDICPRVQQMYKKKIMELKIQKNLLEMQLKALQLQSKKQIESTCSTVESHQTRKNLQSVANEFQIDLLPSKKKQEMTTFQKTVLIYKKKKFTNQKLREKIDSMRRKLQQKDSQLSVIKQVNDNKVWSQLSRLNNEQGDFLVDASLNEVLSMEKIDQKLEFGIDVSNIVKPSKLKTLAGFLEERRKRSNIILQKQSDKEICCDSLNQEIQSQIAV